MTGKSESDGDREEWDSGEARESRLATLFSLFSGRQQTIYGSCMSQRAIHISKKQKKTELIQNHEGGGEEKSSDAASPCKRKRGAARLGLGGCK